MKNLSQYIDRILTKWSLNYIDKVSRTLYPKPHLEEKATIKAPEIPYEKEEEEEEPIMFI